MNRSTVKVARQVRISTYIWHIGEWNNVIIRTVTNEMHVLVLQRLAEWIVCSLNGTIRTRIRVIFCNCSLDKVDKSLNRKCSVCRQRGPSYLRPRYHHFRSLSGFRMKEKLACLVSMHSSTCLVLARSWAYRLETMRSWIQDKKGKISRCQETSSVTNSTRATKVADETKKGAPPASTRMISIPIPCSFQLQLQMRIRLHHVPWERRNSPHENKAFPSPRYSLLVTREAPPTSRSFFAQCIRDTSFQNFALAHIVGHYNNRMRAKRQ